MIQDYGWSEQLQQQFRAFAQAGLKPARVVVQQRGLYQLMTENGAIAADLSGRFTFDADEGGYPVVGDWVAIRPHADASRAVIHGVMPRRSQFVRKAAGKGQNAQVIAANVDVAFLVAALNADFNPRRIERYLSLAWESGASPVIVLTKADLCDDLAGHAAAVEQIALGVPVHTVAALQGEGLEALERAIGPGRTAVLLGSSGAGKSTLVNALSGAELMATQAIREDDARGRHTTTHRELVLLPGGALLLDTPGMRELALWDAEEGISATFGDIEGLAAQCRFNDCAHGREPGCAVQAAIADGSLAPDRLSGFEKLQREQAHFERRDDPLARQAQRKLWTGRHKAYRALVKHRDRQT